jgi:hypothetical protein
MDFTLSVYDQLIKSFQVKGYSFQSVFDFVRQPGNKVVVLRHDVDRLPGNALEMAQMENRYGISASYYFRIKPTIFDEVIIKRIADLGNEIGYHYENMDECNGDADVAIKNFEKNLALFRKLYPVKTICMHGSPLSKWDNRKIWDRYDYREFGIIAEPYFDVDYNKVFYITDTGRMWNNHTSSIRDKVASGFDILIKSTPHLIELVRKDALPNQIMLNVHPQRWFNFGVGWIKEIVGQNMKNMVKTALVRFRK